MAGEGSERVMILLKEMAVLKEEKAADPNGSDEQAHQEREQRCEQILNEIKDLANQKKSFGSGVA